jgi:hypothetical protein
MHNIEEKGKEHLPAWMRLFIKAGRSNKFMSTPKVSDKVWNKD